MGEIVRYCSGVFWPWGTDGESVLLWESEKGRVSGGEGEEGENAENQMDGLRDWCKIERKNAALPDRSLNPEKETKLMGVDAKQTADLPP